MSNFSSFFFFFWLFYLATKLHSKNPFKIIFRYVSDIKLKERWPVMFYILCYRKVANSVVNQVSMLSYLYPFTGCMTFIPLPRDALLSTHDVFKHRPTSHFNHLTLSHMEAAQ